MRIRAIGVCGGRRREPSQNPLPKLIAAARERSEPRRVRTALQGESRLLQPQHELYGEVAHVPSKDLRMHDPDFLRVLVVGSLR